MEIFKLDLDSRIYKTLNRDKFLNKLFSPDKVGKCSLIFDNFYHSVKSITMEEWKTYYFRQSEIMAMKNIINYIQDVHKLDFEDAKNYMTFRLIGQTWNGIQIEFRIIKALKSKYPEFNFEKSDFETDQNYFTDIECFKNDKIVLGIQIKPISYLKMNTLYQINAKKNHQKQRELYMSKNKCDHIILYYDGETIVNYKELKLKLKRL